MAKKTEMSFWAMIRTIVIGALFVFGFEAGARKTGFMDPLDLPDAYLGFPGSTPLFQEIEVEGGIKILKTATNKPMYRETAFTRKRPDDQFRVFCIGASCTRSDSFMRPDGSYPAMLEIYLQSILRDGRRARVINAGGGGMGTIQHVEVLREVLTYEPDLIVICPETGDKNYVPPAPEGIMAQKDDADPLRVTLRRFLSESRLYISAREALRETAYVPSGGASKQSAFAAFFLYSLSLPFSGETFTRLFDFKRDRIPVVMEHPIPRSDVEEVHERYKRNIVLMSDLCKAADVPMVLIAPLRNLKASIYYRAYVDPSEIKPGMKGEWYVQYEAGLKAKTEKRYKDAIHHLQRARDQYVVDRDELLAYALGECHEAMGDFEKARREYELPYLNNPSSRNVRIVANQHGIPFSDPYNRLVRVSENGIPGYDAFTDSVHPMPKTNRIIAMSVVDTLRTQEWFDLAPYESQRVADVEVMKLVDALEAPEHTRMIKALLEGRYEDAARIGQSLDERELIANRTLEPHYLGWALTRLGRVKEAEALYKKLRRQYGPFDDVVPLSGDEDIIRVAFQGELFAWF